MRVPSLFTLKAWLGALGLGSGLFGMAIEQRPLVWVAVALLGLAFVLRFVEKRTHAPPPPPPP